LGTARNYRSHNSVKTHQHGGNDDGRPDITTGILSFFGYLSIADVKGSHIALTQELAMDVTV
jgi:hypothetical protein